MSDDGTGIVHDEQTGRIVGSSLSREELSRRGKRGRAKQLAQQVKPDLTAELRELFCEGFEYTTLESVPPDVRRLGELVVSPHVAAPAKIRAISELQKLHRKSEHHRPTPDSPCPACGHDGIVRLFQITLDEHAQRSAAEIMSAGDDHG